MEQEQADYTTRVISNTRELEAYEYAAQHRPYIVVMPYPYIDLLEYTYLTVFNLLGGGMVQGILNRMEDSCEL
ncbi:MAG: hypothetical protein D6694_07370 [Gammaproteobacteria bacterium]|nr:MAG: hypothetical protein D6694_07370 [Gammaproteobacteria bacterium]